jgi:hypothetical protein
MGFRHEQLVSRDGLGFRQFRIAPTSVTITLS